jgi:hypothetical protein
VETILGEVAVFVSAMNVDEVVTRFFVAVLDDRVAIGRKLIDVAI